MQDVWDSQTVHCPKVFHGLMTAEWEDLSPPASRETTVTTRRYFPCENYNSNWCKEVKARSKHANQRVLCSCAVCFRKALWHMQQQQQLHVRDRTRGHVTANKQWGGLATESGRCDMNTELLLPTAKQSQQEVEQVMAVGRECYLSYPKFAGAKRIVVS